MDRTAQPAAAAGTIKLGDLTVNRLGFGAMRVAGAYVWGMPRDSADMKKLLRRAYELGHNFFDTADSYGPDVSEILIAEALYPYPKDLVIGTKGGLLRPTKHRWDNCGRPDHLRKAVDGSLKKLRLERIDLYQFHDPDPEVPLAESMGALAELKHAGKIRHLGVSNVTVKQLEEARRIAPIVSVQNKYNIADRKDDDVLAACEKAGLAFIPWYPLGAGSVLRSAVIQRVAERRRATTAQVAIAWLVARSPAMLPIPGTRSIAHLEENAAAGTLELSPEDLSNLDRV
jgi:aryl-alcohol dehydrogenase-like predicted oxidoreductase